MINKASLTLLACAAGLACGPAALATEPASDNEAAQPAAEVQAAPEPTLSALLKDVERPELWIGERAPELRLAEFMRGEPVTGFEKGHVYVVEFWATWCGPCIQAFPHLSEVQKKYDEMPGAEVTLIGVNIWERTEGQQRRDQIAAFVDKHQEMQYTVALEEGTAMSETWMKPAGRNGIPSAFIVDQNGQIAWMGHPMTMDEPLAQIVAGEYDAEQAAEEVWNNELIQVAAQRLQESAVNDDFATAVPLGRALINTDLGQDPGALNYVAWMFVMSDNTTEEAAKHAAKFAKEACEKTGWEDHGMIDTLAMAHYRLGERAEAVELIQKAMQLAEGNDDVTAMYAERLAMFRGEG